LADDEKDMATCGACQTEVPADSESCPNCGVSFSGVVEDNLGECGACSALVALDSKTCPQCGVLFVHDDVVAVLADWMTSTGLDVETLFGRLDTDGNGHIDTEELRTGLIALKIAALPPVEVDRLVAEIDQDNNGEIELGELQFILSSGSMQYAESVLNRVMKKHDISDADAFLQFARSFDENENRYLDQKELNKAAEAFVDKPEPEMVDEPEDVEEEEVEAESPDDAEEVEADSEEEVEDESPDDAEEVEADSEEEETEEITESEDSDADEEMDSAFATMISESTDEEAVESEDDESEDDTDSDDDSDDDEEQESSGKGRSFDPSSLIDDDDDNVGDDDEEESSDDMDDLIDSIDDDGSDGEDTDEESEEEELAPMDQESADGIMLEIGRNLNESNTTIDALFEGFDVDESGELDHYEFAKGLKSLDLADLPPHEIDRIVKFLDKDDNGKIDLNELRSNFNEWNVPISDLKPKRFEPAGWQKFFMKQYENVFPVMYVLLALFIAGLLVNALVGPVDGSGGNIAFDGEVGEFSVENNFYVEPGEIYPCDKAIQVTNCANSLTPLAGENGSSSMPKNFYWDGIVGMVLGIGLLIGSVYLQLQTKGWRETVRAERKAASEDSEDDEDSTEDGSTDTDDTDDEESEEVPDEDAEDAEDTEVDDAEEEDSDESDEAVEDGGDGIDVGDRVGVELEDGEEAFGEILEFIEEDDEEFVVVLLDDGDEVEVEFDMIFLEE